MRGIIVMPTRPDFTHEDVLKAAWVRADLPVEDLESALEMYWVRGILPSWWAPGGLPAPRDPTQRETR